MANNTLERIKKKHEEERANYYKPETVKRVALYARQSVNKTDSISIGVQLKDCKARLKPDEPYKEYCDRGYSGKNTDRPAFQEMMQDLRAGKIYKIIVYKLDRCTRSVLDFYQLLGVLDDFHCDFVSVKENEIDTTSPTSKAMAAMTAIFAQLERDTIILRITDNYYSRIERDGRWPGGPSPYGFFVNKNVEPHIIQYDDHEIEAVKIMYNKYFNDNNISLVRIGRILEEQGFKGRKGKNFRTTAILNVLRNPIYTKADSTLYYYFQSLGVTMLNPIEDWTGERSAHIICNQQGKKYTADNFQNCYVYLTNVKGFIESSQYIQIQNRLKQNKQMASGNKPSKMEWLAGLLKCAKCGYGIRIYSHTHKYLSCFGKSVMHECDATFSVKNITFEQVKGKVCQAIQEHINDIENVIVNRKKEWMRVRSEIKQMEEEIEKLLDLSQMVDLKLVADKINEKQAHINQLKFKSDFFYEQLAQYEDIVFMELPDDEKKKIANEMIEKILLSENGDIKVEWKI